MNYSGIDRAPRSRAAPRHRYAALKVRGVLPRGPDTRRTEDGTGSARRRNNVVLSFSLREDCLPRKEVIQPHVPVRLPCYDFTPLTLHTLGASPPRGLGRRLRVQTTRVV